MATSWPTRKLPLPDTLSASVRVNVERDEDDYNEIYLHCDSLTEIVDRVGPNGFAFRHDGQVEVTCGGTADDGVTVRLIMAGDNLKDWRFEVWLVETVFAAWAGEQASRELYEARARLNAIQRLQHVEPDELVEVLDLFLARKAERQKQRFAGLGPS